MDINSFLTSDVSNAIGAFFSAGSKAPQTVDPSATDGDTLQGGQQAQSSVVTVGPSPYVIYGGAAIALVLIVVILKR